MSTIEQDIAEALKRREVRVTRLAQARMWVELMEEMLDEAEGSWSTTGAYYHPRYGAAREDVAAWIRAMKRTGASIKKVYPEDSESYSTVQVIATWPVGHRFAVIGEVKALVSRGDVCERVVVGRREVTEQVPDPDVVKAAPLVEVTHTVEDVEWQCHSILDAA